MATHLIAITARPEDAGFCETAAGINGVEFHQAATIREARNLIIEHPKSLVFWDVDHPGAANANDPLAAIAIGQLLIESVPSERVFALSDQPLNTQPHLFKVPAFGHHIFRRFSPPALDLYSKLINACFMMDPFGLTRYFPDDVKINKIILKKSSERRAATEAVNNVFLKNNLHSRICSLIAQATDELLMNAIFDAPVYSNGQTYRKATNRSQDFDLTPQETVTLELGFTREYGAVCVSDQFGSIQKSAILNFIHKDYSTTDYKVKENNQGAGLGIYGMIQAGVSMLFISKPKQRTDVVILFPMVDSYKLFRSSFRFFSFILR